MSVSYDGICFFGCVSRCDDGEGWAEETRGVSQSEWFDFDEWFLENGGAERFGCAMTWGLLGSMNYPLYYVAPVEAELTSWRFGKVPQWTPAQIAHWTACLSRVREALPGLSAPDLFYGCSIG